MKLTFDCTKAVARLTSLERRLPTLGQVAVSPAYWQQRLAAVAQQTLLALAESPAERALVPLFLRGFGAQATSSGADYWLESPLLRGGLEVVQAVGQMRQMGQKKFIDRRQAYRESEGRSEEHTSELSHT